MQVVPIVEPMTMKSVIPQTPEIVVVPIVEPMTKKEEIPQTREIEEIVEDVEEQRSEIERRPSTSSIRTIATIQINIPNNLNIVDYMNMMGECFRTIIIAVMFFIGLFLMLSTGPVFYIVITCFKKRSTFEIQAFMGSILVCSIFWFVVGKFLM